MPMYKSIIFLSVTVLMVSMVLAKDKKDKLLYRDADQNEDGVVTRDEWRGNSDLVFDHNDLNGDGILSADERSPETKKLTSSFNMLDHDKTGEEHVSFDHFGELDKNKDGVISRLEWHNSNYAVESGKKWGNSMVNNHL